MRKNFHVYHRNLPHWRKKGGLYFVTWRLNDPHDELSSTERGIVENALRFFDGSRYELEGYVVMNDHVHVMARPIESEKLEKIVHSWKTFTAHAINKSRGDRGTVWQREYHDHLIRDAIEERSLREYIVNNPHKRWPHTDHYDWVFNRDEST